MIVKKEGVSLNILGYVELGFAVANAVVAIIPMVTMPALLTPASAWAAILPVLNQIAAVTGIKINFPLAKTICTDAVDTIKAALVKKVAA